MRKERRVEKKICKTCLVIGFSFVVCVCVCCSRDRFASFIIASVNEEKLYFYNATNYGNLAALHVVTVNFYARVYTITYNYMYNVLRARCMP